MNSRWLLLFGLWLLYGSFGLVATSLAPLASLIIDDLSLTHAEMGMAMGAWQLVYVVFAIPAGILLDRIGGRYSLVLGGLLIALSSFARAFADDSTTLLLAVMLFGLGGPIVSAGAPKIVVASFSGQTRGLAMGIYMTGPAIGSIISLSATHSILLPMFDGAWRSVMLLWAVVTLLASGIWFGVASLDRSSERPVVNSTEKSQFNIIIELITKPTVSIILVMSVAVFMFNHGLNNWLPEILKTHNMSNIHAGYWAAFPTIIGIAGSLIIPRLATPERRIFILLALSVTALLASVLLRFNDTSLLFSGLFLQGIAKSSLMTVLILTIVELPEIGEKYAGIASGIFFSAAEIGGMLGPLFLGLLYNPATGFSSGLTLLSCLSMVMIMGSLTLRKRAIQRKS